MWIKSSLDLLLNPGHGFGQRHIFGNSAKEGGGFSSMNKYRKRNLYFIGGPPIRCPPFGALMSMLVSHRLERNSKKPVSGIYALRIKEEQDWFRN